MNLRKRAAERRLARGFDEEETDTAVSPPPLGCFAGFFPFLFLDVWGGERALDEFRLPRVGGGRALCACHFRSKRAEIIAP